MRKHYSFLAITAMAILITAVSVASCKKDSENAPNLKGYTVRQATDIRQFCNVNVKPDDFLFGTAATYQDLMMINALV